MSAGETEAAAYRLTDRQGGGVLFGMTAVQVGFVAVGVGALVFLPAVVPPRVGIVAGLGVAVVCAALAFLPVGGRRLHDALVTVAAFGGRRLAGRQRWMTPLPWSTPVPGPGAARSGDLPPCLTGLDLMMAPRPEWAGGREMLAPVGLVRDRRTGAITVVVPVRGGEFSLLDPADRRGRLGTWAQLLSQFARESSPVVRLGWTLWSAPAPLAEHLGWVEDHQDPGGRGSAAAVRAAEAYRRLVDEAAPTVTRHDLHVWLTIDARRLRRRADPVDAALAAARALSQRCRDADLVPGPPASPVEIAESMRVQGDPSAATAVAGVRRGLAERARLTSPLARVHAAPLAVNATWDAVRVDSAWHRVFWVAQWPTLDLAAGWINPLLLAAPGARTVAVVMEPVSLRTSRRRINADTVSIEGQVGMRERHAFRVPVGLSRAQAHVDQREEELSAGFCEYSYLALVDVCASTRDDLDDACHAMVDLAAQCGITELRPLHGRHDMAWAATLPLGRVPSQPLLRGGA